MIECKIRLQPKQKAFLQAIENTPITFYGGAKGGGKSKGLQLIMLLRRIRYPNSTGAIFRRTYPELEGNHIRPLFQAFPPLREYYNESKKLLAFPNGSTLQFCHCNNESDVDLYQGREFHDLAIDEAGQWPEAMFRRLLGSNRSSQSGIKPRAILTGNPGGIGHGWLKRLFVERRFNERENPLDYTFIQALVDDNTALIENDPAYVARLESEPNEALRKAYRYGDWDIFAGQFFSEIRRETHLIKSFDIPKHWNRFGAYDFGFNHPAAFGWYANDEDGNVYKYRELVQAKLRVDQFAQQVNQYPDTTKLEYVSAGWDCWVQKGVVNSLGAPTVAEEFFNNGITLKRAIIDRIQGAAQLRSYLAWQGRPDNKPRFFIFDTCPITYDSLSRMIHDPDRVEDVLKVDATEGDPLSGDDAYDETRYALMSRPMISDAEIKVPNLRDQKQYVAYTQKLMEKNLEKQAEREIAAEQGNDFDEIMLTMEPDEDPLRYYLNKKRGRI
jgi:phage terminase large subunit